MTDTRTVAVARSLSAVALGMLLLSAALGGAASAADQPAAAAGAQPSHPIVQPGELAFEEIIFVKRRPYSSDHYYTDINNGTSADRFDARNGIYIFNLRTRKERPVVTAAQMPGGKGFLGKISLSFDAKKVVFDFRENPGAGFRVWEVGVDGQGLRQVAKAPPDEEEKAARWHKGWHTDDIHPAYLPDGRIIFSSSRCERTVLCGGSAHLTVPTLHRMKADGTQVEQLSFSPVSEFCPVVLDDGRVMYHRWEYVDKGARVSKTLWSMNPDGSCPQEMFGLSDDATPVYMYPQPMPGSTSRVVCVGTCHFPQGGCLGSILLVDCDMGIRVPGPDPDEPGFVPLDPQYPVVNITPQVFVERHTEPGWHFRTADGTYVHDRNGQKGSLYTHPFPVDQKRFLVSYKVKAEDHYKNVPNAYALYLLGIDGTHRFIHADADLSCWHPTPLVPRPLPPQVQCEHRDEACASKEQAVCVLADIYRGMDGVQRGEVKWIRVNEVLPRYWSTGRRWNPSLSSSSWKGALWPRVQWGVVPVESDGSAHFLVPARRNIFYQALDKDFREIQRERTYVNYAPGEGRQAAGAVPPAQLSPGAALRPEGQRRRRQARTGHPLPHRHPAAAGRQVRQVPQREGPARQAPPDGRNHHLLQHLLRGTGQARAGRAAYQRVHVLLQGRPGQLERRLPAAQEPGLLQEQADGHAQRPQAPPERQEQPRQAPDEHGADADGPLGRQQLPVLWQLLRPAPPAVGQAGDQERRVRPRRLPSPRDLRGVHRLPRAAVAPVGRTGT
ncbi:MAG: hypothetical protein BWX88_00349 [Planctomycetes bacterium ADurb.Bin126]|nr:MAG: hypothetical protein BWX88_00349 [Planctomycetes bacterium ADurb.Bin126]